MTKPHTIGLNLHGVIWMDHPTIPGAVVKKIAQRTAPGKGNVPEMRHQNQQIRAHVIPIDPKTPAQIAQRNRMRAAMTAWTSLTEPERELWRSAARSAQMGGINLFVREYLAAH